ncbi:HD domain-containing protein [Pedobacter fastidiosus]|uniref:HD domain-containing protein n=1 Tax=Pedobacter fastidiosus TaxID=2765361 RepID=A0ABR7KXK5_9SPHI|nr:HD domain-containing protein [Pedobacter fastidiosus]MBC6112477.1 HD domain-containing protein [Pedobacter fastidiosus]
MDRTADKLLTKVAEFVKDQLKNRLSQKMYFHNLEHTLLVVEGAQVIARHTGLSKDDTLIVILSSFLHDLGYTEKYVGHEQASAAIAVEFLLENGFDESRIELVRGCIMATRFPQYPKNELEMVICDADFYHFSLKEYQHYAARLKAEWEENLGLVYTDLAWDKLNLEMLSRHEYFTGYGKNILQQMKVFNIQSLIDRIG